MCQERQGKVHSRLVQHGGVWSPLPTQQRQLGLSAPGQSEGPMDTQSQRRAWSDAQARALDFTVGERLGWGAPPAGLVGLLAKTGFGRPRAGLAEKCPKEPEQRDQGGFATGHTKCHPGGSLSYTCPTPWRGCGTSREKSGRGCPYSWSLASPCPLPCPVSTHSECLWVLLGGALLQAGRGARGWHRRGLETSILWFFRRNEKQIK